MNVVCLPSGHSAEAVTDFMARQLFPTTGAESALQ